VTEDEAPQLVDDYYWLGRAGELVKANSALRADAAKQLMAALAWLWSVYTGAAILGAATASRALSGAESVVLGAPSLLIVLAYAGAVYAYMPLTIEFDPRDPEDVRVAFTEATRRGWRRLRIALGLAALAGLGIAAAIGVATGTV